jgi:hypothetical protein
MWTNKDTAFLKKFLESDTGLKVIDAVKAKEPVMDSDTLEGRALQAAEFSQYRKNVKLIKDLLVISPEAKKVKDQYIEMEDLDVKE